MKYRPHFRIIGTNEWLGVEFIAGPDEPVKKGLQSPSTVRLLYAPEVSHAELQEGTKFEILEGPNVVAVAKSFEEEKDDSQYATGAISLMLAAQRQPPWSE